MLQFQIFISTISGATAMFCVLGILSVFLYIKNYTKDFLKILFTSVSAMFTTYTLKYLLKIPRPDNMLVIETDYRFPSGHATMAAVVMSLIIYYSHIYIKNNVYRYIVYTVAIIWFLLVSYSRLYLHVHYPVDIIAGGVIGIVSTITIIHIFKHLRYYK